MKKLLFTLMALFVAINSWGYAVNEIIKVYDPVTKTESDDFLFFVITDDGGADRTCGLAQCNLSGDIVVPPTVYTKEGYTFKVVQSSPSVSSEVQSKYPQTFLYPDEITSLTYSENLTKFLGNCITGNSMRQLNLPSTLASVNDNQHNNFPNLTKVTIADGNGGTTGNTKFDILTTVEGLQVIVEKKEKSINFIVFLTEDGTAPTEITFPEGIKSINGYNFALGENYKRVKKVNLPASFESFYKVPSQGKHALESRNGCRLTEFTVAAENEKYCAYEGVLYEKPFAVVNGETKPWGVTLACVPDGNYYPYNKNIHTTFTVPTGVTSINPVAMIHNYVTEIVIPEGVATIGESAFYNCAYLTTITIPASATTLGEGFLGSTSKLEEIIVKPLNPNYATYNGVLYNAGYTTVLSCPAAKTGEYSLHANTEIIGIAAFEKTQLSKIDLATATKLQRIETRGLGSLYNITELTIPATVEYIAYTAISGSKLTSITFEDDIDNLNPGLYLADYWYNTSNIVDEIVYPSQLLYFGAVPKSVARAISAAKKISFAKNCRLVNLGRFNTQNKGLKEVDLSNCTQLTTLPDNCFAGILGLEKVTLPPSITTFGDQSFFNTPALETVVFAEGTTLTTIGDNTFQDSGIRNITLPNSVVSVGREAFVRCENLTTVNIPASATDIHYEAFKFCNNLTEFVVASGNPVYASTDGMLADKEKKTLLIFPPGRASKAGTMISPSFTKIGKNAFYACTKLEAIIIPKYVETIENYAFYMCDNLNSITFLGEVPPTKLNDDVARDNATGDPNLIDRRFGNASEIARGFLKEHVTINLRKNGHEDEYLAGGSYWNDTKGVTYSFTAENGKNEDGGKNKYDYLATSLTSVAVLGSSSTNYTAVVPEKVVNPDNEQEYTVAIVGDYAFDHIPSEVKEIVFLGPIEFIGANAFNNGHKDGVYTENPTSSIEQIVFANAETVGKCELSTVRFELGKEFGTEEYPEFTPGQKIYVAKSKLESYKKTMPKFKDQIDYKIPGIKIGTKYGTFSREFDVDLEDEDANWDEENSRPNVAAFTGYVKTVVDEDRDYTYIVMRSINCEEESKTTVKGSGDGTYIPANTGVLLRAYTDGKTPDNFYYRVGESKHDYNSTFSAPAENVMMTVTETGTTIQPTDGDFTNYVISGGKYYSLTGPTNIPVHKSYIHVKEVKESKGIKLVFASDEEATGIEEINTSLNDSETDVVYNLQGQRVNGSAKGIVIKNGKKIFVK